MPHLPGLFLNFGQTEHCRVDCLICLDKVRLVPPFFFHRKAFHLLGLAAKTSNLVPLESNPMETTGAQDNGLSERLWISLCHFAWSFSNL